MMGRGLSRAEAQHLCHIQLNCNLHPMQIQLPGMFVDLTILICQQSKAKTKAIHHGKDQQRKRVQKRQSGIQVPLEDDPKRKGQGF